jgi:two-component system, cell cycle response regulator CtrA
MIDWEARAKVLDAENETLRETNRQLKQALLGAAEPPSFFSFTKSEATIFRVLLANRAPRPEALMNALFSTDVDEAPDEKILDVWICKMRKKLKPHGIEIKTNWGECWEMPESSKEIARQLMSAA